MQGYRRRKPRRDTVQREFWGVQDRSERTNGNKGKAGAKKQGEGETLKRYGGLRNRNEDIFARSTGLCKNALRFRARGLDLPKRRKRYTTSSREEEDAQICPCGKTAE